MDLATILGLVSGATLILVSILIGGSALIFINIPGLLIVVGGTLATTFIKFTMADVIGSISVAMKAFLVKMEAPENIISEMVDNGELLVVGAGVGVKKCALGFFALFQQALQQVKDDRRACVTDVCVVVDGWPAHVHGYPVGVLRLEYLLFTGQCIV